MDNSKVVAFRVMCSPLILSFMAVLACAAVAEGADSLGSTNGAVTARRRPGALRQIAAGRLPKLDRTRSTTPGRQAGTRLLQVVGRFAFEPDLGSGEFSGVDTIYVEVRDDDTIGHSVIWSGFTDTNGNFDTGVVDITDDDNEPDLYVYFETDSPILTVEDGDILPTNYSWDSFDSLLVDDFQGTFYDFGTHIPAVTGVGSSIPALRAFQVITRAHRFVLQMTNINISKVNVMWPAGDDAGYDYDGEITLGEQAVFAYQDLHQYAHHLERDVGMAVSATNDCSNDCQYCDIPNLLLDGCCFCPVTPGVARSEAFAQWFPVAVDRHFEAEYQFDSGEPFDVYLAGRSAEFFPPETIPDDPFDGVTDLSEARAACGADILDNADRVIRAENAFLEDLADLPMDDHAGDGLHECAFLTDGTVLTTYLIDKPADVLALIAQAVFLGGWAWPLGEESGFWWQLVLTGVKTSLLIFTVFWVRATLPRLRIDQLMALCWKVLLPLSLLNLVVVSVYAVYGWLPTIALVPLSVALAVWFYRRAWTRMIMRPRPPAPRDLPTQATAG
ncbi:MAG: NADH-quinone oxidoreductase subunit H [Planctomycetes bacterium]|nr:NADH-quinone oxidoreductase subunit H [Planctomycetota bacterium]